MPLSVKKLNELTFIKQNLIDPLMAEKELKFINPTQETQYMAIDRVFSAVDEQSQTPYILR